MFHEHGLKLHNFFLFQIVCKIFNCTIFFNFRDYCYDGYKGVFCENRCPYPTFGSQCSERCNCSIEFCDHTSGCRAPGKKNVEIEMNKDIIFIGTRHPLQKFVSVGGFTFLPDIYMIFRPVTRKCM